MQLQSSFKIQNTPNSNGGGYEMNDDRGSFGRKIDGR